MAENEGNDNELVWHGAACIQFLASGALASVAKAARAGYEVASAAAPVSADGSHGNPPGFLQASAYWVAFKDGRRVLGMGQDSNGDAVPPELANVSGEGDAVAGFGFNADYAGFVAYGTATQAGNGYIDAGIQAMENDINGNIDNFGNGFGGDTDKPIEADGAEARSALDSIIEGGSSLLDGVGGEELLGLALL